MLQDRDLMKGVSTILQRSERQTPDKLLDTYVDVGILLQLENANNQIVFGRRGTGKTHVFKVLASRLTQSRDTAVIYVDCRTLGSTAQFSDATLSVQQRCTALFRDILNEIYSGLLEYIVDIAPDHSEEALGLLDEFSVVATEGVTETYVTEAATELKTTENAEAAASLEIGAEGIAVGGRVGGSSALELTEGRQFRVEYKDKVVFPAVKNTLGSVLKRLDARLTLLIDEWSSVPFEIQPYLAEFLKRALLPDSRITVKIASLEYRSNFGVRLERDFLGFELGSDIATALDIDDYFVYDRSPDVVTDAFSDMLYLHLRAEVDEASLEKLGITSGKALASKLFTERRTFEELVRASEGVARDMINIFTTAYFDAHRRGRDSIDRKAVVEAARQWFEKDKAQNLEPELQEVLRRIVDEVIGHRRARSFLIPRELEGHSVLRRLFDARVLHLMQRGYADKDNPGRRYNIYTLDYGTYVDLLNTKKEPQVELLEPDQTGDEEFIVPFDDKRSIRRITLSEEILSVAHTSTA